VTAKSRGVSTEFDVSAEATIHIVGVHGVLKGMPCIDTERASIVDRPEQCMKRFDLRDGARTAVPST
jgi:hypothetical protein